VQRLERIQVQLLRHILSIYWNKIDSKYVHYLIDPKRRDVRKVTRAISTMCRELEQIHLPQLIIDQILLNVFSRFNATIANQLFSGTDAGLCSSSNAVEIRLAISILQDWIVQHRSHMQEKVQDVLKQADQAVTVLLVPSKSLFTQPDIRIEVAPDLSVPQVLKLIELGGSQEDSSLPETITQLKSQISGDASPLIDADELCF
jgi:hypothetical protein